MVGALHRGLVALQFEIVIVAEYAFPPFHTAVGLLIVAGHEQLRNLAAKAGRAYYKPFAVLLDFLLVGTRMRVETLGPGHRHQFNQVFVSGEVLGKHNQVTAGVALVDMLVQVFLRHIHFAAEDWTESEVCLFCGDFSLDCGFFAFGGFFELLFEVLYGIFYLSFFLFHIVEILLDAVHIAMVGNCQAGHAVGNGFVDKGGNGSLPVEQGVLRMDVKMNELCHFSITKREMCVGLES